MKKDRLWLKLHRLRRRKRHKFGCGAEAARNNARAVARQRFESSLKKLPKTNVDAQVNHGWVFIDPPSSMNFGKDYSESVSFLMEYRLIASKTRKFYSEQERATFRTYASFELLDDVDPASGIVLAAEIGRWNLSRRVTTHDASWAPTVRDFFHEFGLFDLLRASAQTVRSPPPGAMVRRALPFREGRLTDGEVADRLREELEALCGGTIGPARAIYSAITEAMTNARQHAYPRGQAYWPKTPRKKWWAGGSWSPDTDRVHVVIYDQGVGVPATLPRSRIWSQIKRVLEDGPAFEHNDSALLAAALEVKRTSTAEPGRGKGFRDMTEWIDQTGTGFFRLLSGQGEVTYYPGGKVAKRKVPVPFLGTLVEWEVARSVGNSGNA